jgi:hypothetical protein
MPVGFYAAGQFFIKSFFSHAGVPFNLSERMTLLRKTALKKRLEDNCLQAGHLK